MRPFGRQVPEYTERDNWQGPKLGYILELLLGRGGLGVNINCSWQYPWECVCVCMRVNVWAWYPAGILRKNKVNKGQSNRLALKDMSLLISRGSRWVNLYREVGAGLLTISDSLDYPESVCQFGRANKARSKLVMWGNNILLVKYISSNIFRVGLKGPLTINILFNLSD